MINKKQNVLIAYALVMGTAFFTAFSYIFGKKVSEDLYPETVAFYWFFGAFLFAVIKRLIFMVFGTKFRVPIKELSKYNEVMIISSIITVFGVAFWVIALRSVGPPVTSFLMKFQVVFSVILGAALLNERLRKLEIFGIILTIMGGVVIAYDTSGFELKGSIFAIMAAFCYSCLFIIVRKRSSNLNMMMVATLRSLGVSIIGVLYLLFSDRFLLPSNIDLIYMLIGGTCGPYIGIAVKEFLKNNITKTKVFGSIGNNINIEPPNTLKPLDLGIQSGVSYKLNNINFSGLVSFGILNIRPGGGYGSSIRNVSTQIRVSYDIFKFD